MQPKSAILVVPSCSEGRVDPESYDLLAFARELRRIDGGLGVVALMIGEGLEEAAEDLARQGGVDVTLAHTPGGRAYIAEAYREIVSGEVRASQPACVVAPHTSRGWEWAPGVAARTGAACITGVNAVCRAAGGFCFLRDLYGGKVKERCIPRTATTIVTVQPGVFRFGGSGIGPGGRVSRKTAVFQLKRSRFLGTRQAAASTSRIGEAPIVVSAGNGIGDRENLERVHELARMLPKSVVGGTRILCDRGWLGYDRQVGVTGATVAPALYIALGISGAAQHVMGMRASGFVIAVNTDPRAPIFNEADVGIVEDVDRFIPLVLAAFEKESGNGAK